MVVALTWLYAEARAYVFLQRWNYYPEHRTISREVLRIRSTSRHELERILVACGSGTFATACEQTTSENGGSHQQREHAGFGHSGRLNELVLQRSD